MPDAVMNAVERKPVAELLVRPDVGEISRSIAWMETVCIGGGVPDAEISRLELCLHEALVNVITHGKSSFPITLQLDISVGEAAVTISDSCSACNPLTLATRPTPKSLAEAEPGGLGLLMIRKISDTQNYRYQNGQNRFTFSVRWKNA